MSRLHNTALNDDFLNSRSDMRAERRVPIQSRKTSCPIYPTCQSNLLPVKNHRYQQTSFFATGSSLGSSTRHCRHPGPPRNKKRFNIDHRYKLRRKQVSLCLCKMCNIPIISLCRQVQYRYRQRGIC